MTKAKWIGLSMGVLLALSGCGNDPVEMISNTDGGADAGAGDSSVPNDTGTPTDMSVPTDTGTPTDAGTPTDGGTPMDGDVPVDMGTPADLGADAGLATIALEDLPDAYVNAYCDLVFSCSAVGGSEELRIIKLFAGTLDGCRAALGRLLLSGGGGLTRQTAGVDSGLFTYDPVAAAECVSSFSCEILDRGPSRAGACENVFAGTVAADGDCNSDDECAGVDVRCERAEGLFSCPGTCTTAVALGAPCIRNEECTTSGGTADVQCTYSPADEDYRCLSVTTATVGVDSPCGASTLDGTHLTVPKCEAGLYCDYSGDPATCRPAVLSGAECSDTAECADGLFCIEGVCGDPPTIVNTAGGACDEEDEESGYCNPFRNLACDSTMCVELGDGSLGSACSDDGDFGLPCNPGLYCDGTDHCAARAADGETCTDSDQCLSDNCSFTVVAGGTGVCAAQCRL